MSFAFTWRSNASSRRASALAPFRAERMLVWKSPSVSTVSALSRSATIEFAAVIPRRSRRRKADLRALRFRQPSRFSLWCPDPGTAVWAGEHSLPVRAGGEGRSGTRYLLERLLPGRRPPARDQRAQAQRARGDEQHAEIAIAKLARTPQGVFPVIGSRPAALQRSHGEPHRASGWIRFHSSMDGYTPGSLGCS